MKNYTNSVAKVIHIFGQVYVALTLVGGMILGNIMADFSSSVETILGGYSKSGSEFSWTIVITSWILGIMFSLVFFGAAEIIELLYLQKEETTKLLAVINTNVNPNIKPEVTHPIAKSFDDLPEL